MATFLRFGPSVYAGVFEVNNKNVLKTKWKKTTGWLGMILLVLSLTACFGNSSEPGMNASGETNGNQTDTDNNVPDDAAAETKQGTAPATESTDSGATSELPAEKSIEVELEGMKETRTATLQRGEGYAFYMFDIFSFDAKTNKLMMNYDSDYHVVITKLPADYNIEELAKSAKSEMSKIGKVEQRTGDQLYETMRDAELFLIAQGKGLTQQYIVKNIGGQGFAFLLNSPHGEASEGFGPLAFASINTVVATN